MKISNFPVAFHEIRYNLNRDNNMICKSPKWIYGIRRSAGNPKP